MGTDECFKSEGDTLMGKRYQGYFGYVFQIVFYSVFDNVIHVDDELFEFVESLMHVIKIGVNVH